MRSLEISFNSSTWNGKPEFDLSSILRCEGLESLALYGMSRADISCQLGARVLSLLGRYSLKSLALDVWPVAPEGMYNNCTQVLQQIAEAAPSTLVHLKVAGSLLDLAVSGTTAELSSFFLPLNGSLKRLDCKFNFCAGSRIVFRGWDCLEELTLKWGPCSSRRQGSTKIIMACPLLKSLKVQAPIFLELEFEGPHERLATLDLDIGHSGLGSRKAGVQTFLKLLETIRSFGSVANLSIGSNFCFDYESDRRIATTLASIPSLRSLKLGYG